MNIDYDFNEWIHQIEADNNPDKIRVIHPVIIPSLFVYPNFVEV